MSSSRYRSSKSDGPDDASDAPTTSTTSVEQVQVDVTAVYVLRDELGALIQAHIDKHQSDRLTALERRVTDLEKAFQVRVVNVLPRATNFDDYLDAPASSKE